jgi:two-component system, cell cycle response regulator
MVSQSGDDEDTVGGEKTAVVIGNTFNRRMEDLRRQPPCLIMLQGPAGYVGKKWPIDKPDLIIGRSMNAQIFIDDRSVSKSHAKIQITANDVFIIDLESTNKTVVNDVTIPALSPRRMSNNDQIKTGNVLFKFLESGSMEAHAIDHLAERSERDALTGAYNKGALLTKGPDAFKRAKALSVPLCAVVFDIDHFKKVNDTLGHPCGDYVLKELAAVVQSKLIRADDFFARYGGEEFVVILFGSNLPQGVDIGERLRTTIEQHNFVWENKAIPVRISVGVASMQREMSTWEELLNTGDAALYTSKRSGRNKVTAVG